MAVQGEVIAGKYEILKQIGKGGMSVVYLAMDRRRNKQWAVKEIRRTAGGRTHEDGINSLLAEARLMQRLSHPALPQVADILDDGKRIFIVMDYIEGESLDKILKEYGAQPQGQVIDWAKQLCDVLEYLHSQKPPVIYRDMKPSNIIQKPEGNLKLIDFGIAREYKEKSPADTAVLGTKGYAPPEQHGSRQTDARSDIYALGMTMHHLLTGADPGAADYVYAPVRRWNPEVSGGLERVIGKCTAFDPKDRYQNCSELLYALEHYEEEDGEYKKRQKRKLVSFAAAAAAGVICLGAGGAAYGMSVYENSKDYEQKINISSSTPYKEKVDTYLAAIDLDGTDARGYKKLLEAYRERGEFAEEQSSQFTAKYNLYKDQFDMASVEYLDLAYEAGITYFYLYSGGDQSFRTRILKAYPYFKAVTDSTNTSYRYYSVSGSYRMLGEFYQQYVADTSGIREPARETYGSLLGSLKVCMDKLETYDYDDAAYIRLTMYREIANLLNDHRKGLAAGKLDKAAVLGILEQVAEKTEALSVTRQASVEIRDFILENVGKYAENIARAYENEEKRGD